MPATSTVSLRDLASQYSQTKRRTIDVAYGLFAEHGVGGTSLQMIADELGVTKAAIYHQFATKDAIIVAALEVQLEPVEELLERAEASDPGLARREELLAALIELVVANRRSLSTLQSEPVLFRLLAEYPPSLEMWTRLFAVLIGDGIEADSQLRGPVLSAALGTVAYPFVIDLADDVLRDELLRMARHILFTPL
jgi:AcrR family transcriptional regulator